jgi:hypothetical protein
MISPLRSTAQVCTHNDGPPDFRFQPDSLRRFVKWYFINLTPPAHYLWLRCRTVATPLPSPVGPLGGFDRGQSTSSSTCSKAKAKAKGKGKAIDPTDPYAIPMRSPLQIRSVCHIDLISFFSSLSSLHGICGETYCRYKTYREICQANT